MDLLHERLEMARRIARELVGTLPEEEREVLERWKAADERHRAEYEAIRQRLASGKEVWEELWRADRLAERKWKGMARRRRGRVLRWVGYAAAVVLVAGAGIYLYASREVPGEVPTAQSPAIVPGSAKAILTLSGGERLQLDDTTRVTLQEAGGTIIHKEGGVMTYASTEAEPERVEYNTLATPRGGEHAIVLADGTRAWLNAESSLTYPVRFTGGERRVEMQGEVYFEVAPDEEHPFVVESRGVDIRVLGTSFNVASREEMVVTTLVEGKVEVGTPAGEVVLVPGKQVVWDREEGKIYTDCLVEMYSPDGYMKGYGMESDEMARNASILVPFDSYAIIGDSLSYYVDTANFIGPVARPNPIETLKLTQGDADTTHKVLSIE